MAGYRPTQIRKPSDETEFERNCVVLFKDLLTDPNVKRVGTRGQRQRGVDIIGKRDRDSKQPVGVQCKLKSEGSKLTDGEVREEVRKALTFRPKLTEYFIVTTSKDDTLLDELGKQLCQHQEAKGRKIQIEIWGWDTLSDKINQSESAKEAFDPGFSPSIAEQTRKLEAVLAGQKSLAKREDLVALADDIRKTASEVSTRLPPQFADRELKDCLLRALRRRGFGGTNTAAELAALADRGIDGELSLGNNQLRAEICDRAARSNITVDHGARSRRFRSYAGQLDPARDFYTADALLTEVEGDPGHTLRCLRSRSDLETRSAFFMTLLRQRGTEAALEWVASENLLPSSLDAGAALSLVHNQILSGRFEEALTAIARVPQPYFNECPALIMLRAQLTLVSMLPADQKSAFFQGLPENPRILQLARGSESQEKLAAANADIQHLLGLLRERGLPDLESCLSELDIWLRLQRPTTQEAARQQLAKEIVDPATTLQRVRLALAYGIPFNQEALERHLASRNELGGWTADERHAGFLIAFHSSDPKRMVDFFDAHHDDLFAQSDLGRTALAGIEIEAFVRVSRFEDARRHIALHRGTDLTPEQAADIEGLVAHIEKGDEVESFRRRYSQSQSLTDLRLLVGALRARRDLKQLSDYAPHLARATKALEDFDLAIKSLFDSKRYCELLELAENLPELQKLDDDYAAFKGWAFYQLGRVREARETARCLLARRDVAGDRELAVATAIETGDWGNLQAILAHEVSRVDTLAPSDLIRLARLALEAGSPYVDQFRDAALRKAPDDPEINLAAYTLAIERGSEYQGSEAHTWFQKAIVGSGSEGPVRAVSMRELIEQVPHWNKHRETVDQMLRRSDVPFFMAAKAVRRQVIDLTLGQALRNTDANDRRIKYPVLAFSGAQPECDIAQAKSVALDITAIVTLDYIGLLEKALERFDPIVIAPRTLSTLFMEREFLKFHQPSQMAKARRLQALITADRLKVVAPEPGLGSARSRELGPELAALLAAAEREGGLVVRSAPVFKLGSLLEERVEMGTYAPVLTDTLAVVSFLSSHGKLDSEIQERAERYLKQADSGWEKAQAIGPQSKLYLDSVSVSYLDHVGLLEILTRSVPSVFIHADFESYTCNLLRHDRHADELLDAIERIRTVIAVQVEAGRVQFSARRAADKTEDEEGGDILASSPTLDLMSDLSRIDAVVADDRCLNKLANWTDGSGRNALATSSLSILTALKARGQLDEQAYWRARHRLRAAGYYAVPLEAAELLHHLAHAPIADGRIRETPELKAARECLSLPRINEIFVPADEPWLNRQRYTVYKSIRESWLNSPDLDRARAEADWLWSIHPNPLEWCLSPEVEAVWAAARQQAAVQIGLMMLLIDAPGERKSRYFAWLEETVLQPLREMHPEVWQAAFKFLKSYITQLIEARDQDAQRAA